MSTFGGGSLFGSKPAGSNLFGSTNTNTQQSAQTSGLFGSNTNTGTNTPQPGLFGNTQPQTQQNGTAGTGTGLGGGLFGSNNNQQQNPGQAGTTGGGLFGNAGSSASGSGTTGGGIFGNTGANGGGSGTSTGGGLFGNTGTNTGGTMGGSLFGNTSTNQPATGGSLFGSAPSTASTQQQPTTGNLFGTSTSNQPGGGLFGNTTSSNTAAPGGSTTSLFGQPQQQPSTSFFGQPQQQPSSLFSSVSQQPQQQQPPLGSSLLGSSLLGKSTLPGLTGLGASTTASAKNGLFSSRLPTAAGAGQREQDAHSQFLSLQQRIEGIIEAWNPQSPNNRFQRYFYNFVLPEEVHLYGRPANITNEESWQEAVRENPDPSCLVPVLATSFDDLHARVQGQVERSAQHTKALTELQTRISQLSSAHALSTSPRLARAIAAQTQLTHRLLKLVTHIHLLIPALRSSAIRPEEEALRGALEEMEGEVLSRKGGGTNVVSGMGRLVAKLNEMWAVVGALNALKSGNEQQGVSWAVVDEDGLNQIVQILAEEQAGLAHLTKILRKDMKDVAVIYGEGDGQLDESVASPKGRTELMSSFSQTLRTSALR